MVLTSRRWTTVRWGPGPALVAVVVACGVGAAALYVAAIRGAGEISHAGRANAVALEGLGARLGLAWTHGLSGTRLAGGYAGRLWAMTYAVGYWPFLASAAAWTLAFDRARFRHFAAVIGVSGLVGVVVMAAFPVSPPRFMGAPDLISGTAPPTDICRQTLTATYDQRRTHPSPRRHSLRRDR